MSRVGPVQTAAVHNLRARGLSEVMGGRKVESEVKGEFLLPVTKASGRQRFSRMNSE